jgi:hypothetical protein
MPCTCPADAGQRCPAGRPGAIVICVVRIVGLRDLAQCGRRGAGRMPCDRSAWPESAAQYLCRPPPKAVPCICPARARHVQGRRSAAIDVFSDPLYRTGLAVPPSWGASARPGCEPWCTMAGPLLCTPRGRKAENSAQQTMADGHDERCSWRRQALSFRSATRPRQLQQPKLDGAALDTIPTRGGVGNRKEKVIQSLPPS